MNKKEFNIKLENLKKNDLLKSLMKDELISKNDRCDYKTYIVFNQWINPFFEKEFPGYKYSAISYIFNEDILDICEDREEDLDYFVDCLDAVNNNELSCLNCKNKSICYSEFGEKIDIKKSLIVLYFTLKHKMAKNNLLENTIDSKTKSFMYNLKSFANKEELIKYLCSNFMNKYLNCDNWGLIIAQSFLDTNIFNEHDFSIIKDYYNKLNINSHIENDNYNNIVERSSALKELHKMIGLKMVKDQIAELYDLLCFKKLTQDKLELPNMSLNCTFEGNPGTGKTKTAKLYAKLLYQTGFIKSDKLTCVCAKDLIAGHIGGTAIKTAEVIEKALGGVLFIDEAYQLIPTNEKDFGRECIATLIREMTEHQNDLVIIFAGYKDEMEEFININPGMKSRITNRIVFEDYSIDELYEIFKLNAKEAKFNLSNNIESFLKHIFKEKAKDKSFGNARFVENLFQEMIIKHSRNIMQKIREKQITPDCVDIETISVDDIPFQYHTYIEELAN